MYEFAIKDVLSLYNVKYKRIFEPEKGYRNEIWPVETVDGQMVNVTFLKSEDGIVDRANRADAVSAFLSENGMLVRTRIDKRLVKLTFPSNSVYVGLYNYLAGQTIPWESYTMNRIKNLGKTMSDMHYFLSLSEFDLPSVYDEYQLILQRMDDYFIKSGVVNAMSKKLKIHFDVSILNEFKSLLTNLKRLPAQQALHMDFVRGNILFNGDEVCGILDFEKAALGHPVMEIARTLAFLLVDCKHKPEDKVYKYFVQSGYIKRGMNTDAGEKTFRDSLVKMFLLYDLYKFMRHNPYESLYENEHYIRTKDILVKYGLISLR
jgi:Ser/Thr protein kinase RdoA (MazF antagonist)